MSTGLSELDDIIARLKSLGTLTEEIATEAAPLVEAAVRQTAAAGTDPEGHAWAPKKDGTRALVGVEDKITASASGKIIQVVLVGGAVFWNSAKGKTRPQRRVLPDGGAGMPKNVGAALTQAAQRVYVRKMGAQ